MKDYCPAAVVADKGYDASKLIHSIEERDGPAVIPSRRNARKPRTIDENLYKDCNKTVAARSSASLSESNITGDWLLARYEKTARSFLAFWHLASIITWLLYLSTRPRNNMEKPDLFNVEFAVQQEEADAINKEFMEDTTIPIPLIPSGFFRIKASINYLTKTSATSTTAEFRPMREYGLPAAGQIRP